MNDDKRSSYGPGTSSGGHQNPYANKSFFSSPRAPQPPPPPQQPLPQPGPPVAQQPPYGPPPAGPGYGGPQFSLPPPGVGRTVVSPGGGSPRRKLLIAVIAMVVILGGSLLALLASGGGSKQPQTPANDELTRQYDSPMGLIPDFRGRDIKNGKFKLTASYVGDSEFTRQGNFYIKDHKIHFDMLPDVDKVNELLKYLYGKKDINAGFNDVAQGATRNFTYDFASMLDYAHLYDKNTTFGNFIPMVEAAKADPNNPKNNQAIKLGEACDTALAELKSKTGDNIHTKSLSFDYSEDGQKTQATVSFAARQSIDKAIVAFFDGCFDINREGASAFKEFVDDMREHTTPSPTYTYWKENNTWFLTVSAPSKDAPFGGELKFELTDLDLAGGELTGRSAPYTEARNKFGLTYGMCHTIPVVQRLGVGYRFVPEDVLYSAPSELDIGYYCSTLGVPVQYKPPTTMTVQLGGASERTVEATTPAEVDAFRVVHDLAYETEKYNLDNKRYPGPTEFTDLASNNMGKLTSVAEKLLTGRKLTYQPIPVGCVGNCSSYSLLYAPEATVTIKRSAY